jgi:hypothetical protein
MVEIVGLTIAMGTPGVSVLLWWKLRAPKYLPILNFITLIITISIIVNGYFPIERYPRLLMGQAILLISLATFLLEIVYLFRTIKKTEWIFATVPLLFTKFLLIVVWGLYAGCGDGC